LPARSGFIIPDAIRPDAGINIEGVFDGWGQRLRRRFHPVEKANATSSPISSMRDILNIERLALRWTIGEARERGFEMLRLSITCAFRLFGPSAKYLVCVNSLPAREARERTGSLPVSVEWLEVTHHDLPPFLQAYCDHTVGVGMGWKLAPLRTYPERYELALDNDCILWEIPDGMREWLDSEDGCLFAEDVDRCVGSFDALCPPGNLNAGLRGLPPGVDLGAMLDSILREASSRLGEPVRLVSDNEEQGLQAAAICRMHWLFLVRTTEVSLCSPFWHAPPSLECVVRISSE
jgi:hypothetical protein